MGRKSKKTEEVKEIEKIEEEQPEKNKKSLKKTFGRKLLISIISGLVVVAIAGVLVFYNSRTSSTEGIAQHVSDFLDYGEYEDIRELIDIMRANSNSDNLTEIRNTAFKTIDGKIELFRAKIYTLDDANDLENFYDDFHDRLNELQKDCLYNDSGSTIYLIKENKVEDLLDKFDGIYFSKQYFIEGEQNYYDEKYDEALTMFSQVDVEDGAYSEVAKYQTLIYGAVLDEIKAYIDDYLENMVDTPKAQVSYYEGVIKYLNGSALNKVKNLEENEGYIQLKAEYLSKYRSALDQYVKGLKDNEEIARLYEKHLGYVTDPDEYSEILKIIEKYRPSNLDVNNPANPISNEISLIYLEPIERKSDDPSYSTLRGCYTSSCKYDNDYNVYDGVISLNNYYDATAYVTYDLGKRYSKFTGTLYELYYYTDLELKINVYGDNKLLYSKVLSDGVGNQNISLDVSNVEYLKIETISMTKDETGSAFALGDAKLSFKKIYN